MAHLFRLFLFCFPLIVFGQEVQINSGSYHEPYHTTYRFNDQFKADTYSRFYLGSASLYKERKVKTVKILEYNRIVWMAELDRAGTVLKTGQNHNGYFRTEEAFATDSSLLTVTAHYLESRCVRIDSVFRSYIVYPGDTIIRFTRATRKTHKSGSLINQQNTYYNEHYLNVAKPAAIAWISSFDVEGTTISGDYTPEVYFSDPLKTDYDDSVLYLSKVEKSDEDLSILTDRGVTGVEFEQVDNDAFCRDYRGGSEIVYLTEGEDFDEPSELVANWYCEGGSVHSNDYELNTVYDYTPNEKGLHASYFSNYYPPEEPAVVAKEELPPYLRVRRTTMPVKTVYYTFDYEYFD